MQKSFPKLSSGQARRQIELLELQYKRMGEPTPFAREIEDNGAAAMNFDVFDKSESKPVMSSQFPARNHLTLFMLFFEIQNSFLLKLIDKNL